MRAKGFTLVEILIVVVILGILAAIVIPQFTDASTDAKESSLMTDLQTVRAQLELYKIQHNDAMPVTTSSAAFWTCLTTETEIDGTAGDGSGNELGPYLQKAPTNQFNLKSDVEIEPGVTGLGDNSHGWHLNTSDKSFHADDNIDAAHKSY